MKYIKLLLIFATIGIIVKAENIDNLQNKITDCKFREKKLYDHVKVVTVFSDFKVKRVNSFQFVDFFEDFTVMFVESFEDFSIKYPDSFSGMS